MKEVEVQFILYTCILDLVLSCTMFDNERKKTQSSKIYFTQNEDLGLILMEIVLYILDMYCFTNNITSSIIFTISIFRITDVYIPQIYYVFGESLVRPMQGDDVLLDDYLKTRYTFSPVSRLEYRLATYSYDGSYLGLNTVQNGRIQLCADTTNKLNAAFVFGTTYKQSVS